MPDYYKHRGGKSLSRYPDWPQKTLKPSSKVEAGIRLGLQTERCRERSHPTTSEVGLHYLPSRETRIKQSPVELVLAASATELGILVHL